MGRTVEELSETMSYPAFKKFLQYWEQEPFGAFADDYRNARLCALLANCHSAKGKRFVPKDFMFNARSEPQSDEEKLAVLTAAMNAFKGLSNGH